MRTERICRIEDDGSQTQHTMIPTAELDALRAQCASMQRLRAVAQMLITEIGADGPMDAEDAAAKAVQTIRSLRDWQAGAMAAAWISYPPGMPPHTEAVYCAHKADYMSRSEDYRLGADEVAAAILSVKDRLGCGEVAT